jgi:hypothetical protein
MSPRIHQSSQSNDSVLCACPKALDWTWRHANIVQADDPWTGTGLRSAIVGDVFLVNGVAHAVTMAGFERFEFQREGDSLILHGRQVHPPILLKSLLSDARSSGSAERKNRKDRR